MAEAGQNADYSAEELGALRAVFNVYDDTGEGYIAIEHIPAILEKLGRNATEEMMNDLDAYAGEDETISFGDLLTLLRNHQDQQDQEQGDQFRLGPDPKVMEFITILEEYRMKCEEDGNYLEAQRADTQLAALRKQEFKRQSKSLRAKQIAERQDIQIAHNMQFNDFNQAWDQYMEEYDRMAQAYVKQMTEKHAVDLREFQEKLQQEILERPPKFSKELIEWRRRQHRLAQQKQYTEAQKIKKIADEMEEDERAKMNEEYRQVFVRKEAKLRQQQQAELQALLKRIDGRRKEHLKQRNLDSKRLLQRNRNVQAVLESKQVVEATKKLQDIKMSLLPKDRPMARNNYNVIPAEARVVRPKKPSTTRPPEFPGASPIRESDALDRELASLAETINLSNPLTYGTKGDWKTSNRFNEEVAKQEAAHAKSLPNTFVLTDPHEKKRAQQPYKQFASLPRRPGRINQDGSLNGRGAADNQSELQLALQAKKSSGDAVNAPPRKHIPAAKRSHMDGILRGIPCDQSPVKSTQFETHDFTEEMRIMDRDKNTSFFRKRDSYSEYVEARARFSKMHSVT
ncbi:TPA: hypothetical protein N0F65_009445 [Lagenidium giganteum]|uniref:EF-hand domain-containing protein n=1 Tax=Lagenidium giganteum TaxID=4803 RepID=A0AAV2ZGK8_9STRA|nr:TPA: hypothetical protein N0F65_009445 [Lagenidium giganteum]